MSNWLSASALWRVLAALGAFFSRLGQGSALLAALGRAWKGSGIRGWFCRRLGAEALPTAESGLTAFWDRWNVKRAQKHALKQAWPHSVPGRVYGTFMGWGRESRLLGWVFRGGMTSILLFVLGGYALLDYLLRDLLPIPVLSSVWDEALLLFGFFWVVWQRMHRVSPLRARTNPLDLPILGFLTVGFVLMNLVSPYFSIQISGYRATVQQILWFFVLTRILRDENDVLTLYLTLVGAAAAIAVHGIYQYIVDVPMPAQWVAAAETAVRTRVYSIFGSPNIMGDFMVMFVPMAVALAYYCKKTGQKLLAWLCALLMCFACLFTMSRGAWVGMVVTIVLFILLVDRRLFWVVLGGCLLLLLIPFVRTRIGFLFTAEFVAANTNGGRGERWVKGMELLRSYNPLLGVGLGMFGGAVAMQNKLLDWVEYFYLDNYYMKILVEMGFAGLVSFVLMLVCWLHTGFRSLYRTYEKKMEGSMYPLCAGILSGLAGVLTHCFFENIFEEPYMLAYFWLHTAMLVWCGFLRKKQPGRHG